MTPLESLPAKTKDPRFVRAGRKGHLKRLSTEGGRSMIVPAAEGWLARFKRQVDPDNVLDPADREQRARAARALYMTELAERRWSAHRADAATQ